MKRFFPIMLVMIAGCGAFRVLFPPAMQVGSQDFIVTDDNRIQIAVQFNKAVDLASIAIPQAFIQFENNVVADIEVTGGDVAAEAIITTVEEVGQLCTFDPDCSFTLFLHGSAANPVMSTSGEALDGDNDGTPGGTYETSFIIIG
ncbi:MAG: hypothetical protein ACXAC5_02415 [Promethearchaeota archaeon]|jgi:hypothetical protein